MNLSRDLMFALRRLKASPGYAAAVVVTLALVIGATTAIFSAVHAVLLTGVPIRQPEQLVVAWGVNPKSSGVIELTYVAIEELVAATPGIGAVASVGSSAWTAVLDGEGEPRKIPTVGVSGRFFDVLGTTPRLGRLIRVEDDAVGAARVGVISHAMWQREFGSDPGIIGRRIRLDDMATEIVGVAAAGFDYPLGTEVWLPVKPIIDASSAVYKADALSSVGVLFMLARLNDGVTPALAAERWSAANARLQEGTPATRYNVVSTPFLDYQIGPARRAIWILFAAVGVLLLIACANVSGLMLTRSALRNREDAVRLAIGGSRSAIARQWALEAALLSTTGGFIGLLLARWFAKAFIALAPDGIPRLDDVSISAPVAAFSFAVMAAVTMLCAAAPIRQTRSLNLSDILNDGSRTIAGARSYRTRSALLVLQIAMSVVLLVGAGLIVRSFSELQRVDLGFDPRSVLTLKIEPRLEQPTGNEWMRELLPRIEALAPVEAAGAVALTPMELGSIGQGTWVLLEGEPNTAEAAQRNPFLNYQVATPGYFRALGIDLVRGRLFDETDTGNTERVCVIGERTAQVLFPGVDPVGKQIRMATFAPGGGGVSRTIVGVVDDVRYRGINEVQLDVYDPATQSPLDALSVAVRVRETAGITPLAVAAAIQREARALDPRVLISGITTMDAVVASAMAPWRFSAWVFALFAALAFVLAAVGLFSVVSLDVTSRRHEFAIRSAVGATAGAIVGRVMVAAAKRVLLGIVIGAAVATLATRALTSLLFGIDSRDPATFAAVLVLVTVMVAIAAYLPARRAAAIDPSALLR
jgi:putative ABC transport system permease protein